MPALSCAHARGEGENLSKSTRLSLFNGASARLPVVTEAAGSQCEEVSADGVARFPSGTKHDFGSKRNVKLHGREAS
jgi:hypothetical protein